MPRPLNLNAISPLWKEGLVVSLVLSLSGLILLWANPGYPVDDAAITYRYAQKIAQGQGFVYNIGQPVQGTSTPLFTLLLALAAWSGGDLIRVGVWLGMAATCVNCLLVYLIGRALRGRFTGALAALLFATNAHVAANASSGMETPLYLSLVLAAFLAYHQRSSSLSMILAGLCALMRLDGLAVGATLWLTWLWQRRRFPGKETSLFLGVVLPWFLFAQLHFGTVVPLSLLAKQSDPSGAEPLWMVRFFLNSPFEMLWLPVMLYVSWLLAVDEKARKSALPLVIWFVLYLTAYTLVGIDEYDWYLVVPIPVVYLLFAAGLDLLVSRLLPASGIRRDLALIGLVGFLLFYQLKYTWNLIPTFKQQAVAVESTRIAVGKWLAQNTPPDAVIATDGIGHIGYYSQRPIIDLLGLVTPLAVGRPYMETLQVTEADYAVSVVSENAVHPFKSSEFLAHYILIGQWDGSREYYGPHMLYQRRVP